jgi:hypothetical protein
MDKIVIDIQWKPPSPLMATIRPWLKARTACSRA